MLSCRPLFRQNLPWLEKINLLYQLLPLSLLIVNENGNKITVLMFPLTLTQILLLVPC